MDIDFNLLLEILKTNMAAGLLVFYIAWRDGRKYLNRKNHRYNSKDPEDIAEGLHLIAQNQDNLVRILTDDIRYRTEAISTVKHTLEDIEKTLERVERKLESR